MLLLQFSLTRTELDQKTYEFIYGQYNHKRPHTHNGGRTPMAARYAA